MKNNSISADRIEYIVVERRIGGIKKLHCIFPCFQWPNGVPETLAVSCHQSPANYQHHFGHDR